LLHCCHQGLRLNDRKTEVIWPGTCYVQQLACINLNLSVRSDIIRPSIICDQARRQLISLCDPSVFVDADLTFDEHVRHVTSRIFFHLRHFCPIQKHANCQVMKQLVHALVISRLDYCNCNRSSRSFKVSPESATTSSKCCCQTCTGTSTT